MPRVGQALPEIIHCVHCQMFHAHPKPCVVTGGFRCPGCYPDAPAWLLPVAEHRRYVSDLTINLAVVFGAASMAVLLAIAIVWILS